MIKFKKIISLIVMIFMFVLLVSCKNEEDVSSEQNNQNITETGDKYYNITFKDENGEILSTISCKEGSIPTYNSTPKKAATEEYVYKFSGWSPSLQIVSADATYTATYSKTKQKYTYFFYLDELYNSTFEKGTVDYGTTVIPPSNPTKTSNDGTEYEFIGWYNLTKSEYATEFTITENTIFCAKYKEKDKYTVTWKNYDGKILETDTNLKYGDTPIFNGFTPTRQKTDEYTYTFAGWDKEIENVTGDVTYTAIYTSVKNKYTVLWKNYDGTILETDIIEYGETPSYDGNTPSRPSTLEYTYTFVGWDKEITNVTGDVTYTATFTNLPVVQYNVNYYFQNVNDDNYTLNTKMCYQNEGIQDSNVTIIPEEIDGFVTPDKQSIKLSLDSNNTIDIYYDRMTYKLVLEMNIENAGSVSNGGTYKYGQEIEINASVNDIYRFVGWYLGADLRSSSAKYKVTMPANDLTLNAVFEQYKFKLTTDSLIPGFRVSYKENYYEAGKNVSLDQVNGFIIDFDIDWTRSDGVTYTGKVYNFVMPAYDLHVQITTDNIYFRKSDCIYFGSYPQSQNNDTKLIESLNEKYGLPSTNSNWVSYGYYEGSVQSDFMYYIDVDYDDNGVLDFRGVYFTQYRPYISQNGSSKNSTSQDENGYNPFNVYWFNYDIIEWEIMSESNGYATIYASYCVDSQAYNSYYPISDINNVPYEHNGGTGFSNSYVLSDIRKWLHYSFYLTAFNDLQKSIIQATTVSTESVQVTDYVFLLSREEAVDNGLLTNYLSASSYAKCQGFNQGLWTRTAVEGGICAVVVKYPFAEADYVATNSHGIIPAIKIKL